ncbi:TetR family transcriptional regulator [Amycolatopsis pithecellobii]|uniref:TetR family transcriptional regulator n=1 Tax=Amycolatopsis pithecellobii TaxID=664692 RepID=A0A6N7Z2W3_9PSEU|nr:TetR family transcriptional regulator [Amycolatopsis pithecellobii]MTD53116.1 TetR family transcriptional regulator [Amycolatopsis pithecellobii]
MARRTEDDLQPVTRERILTVAAALMAQRGYRGTNLNDVAGALDVTRQALYHHFRNKQAILSSIFHLLFDRLLESAEQVDAFPAATRFRELFSVYIDVILEDTAIAAVAVNEYRELLDPDRHAMQKARQRYFELLENSYSAGVAAGTLLDIPPRVAVRVAIGTVNWATRWYRPDGPASPERTRSYIEQIVFTGIERADPH